MTSLNDILTENEILVHEDPELTEEDLDLIFLGLHSQLSEGKVRDLFKKLKRASTSRIKSIIDKKVVKLKKKQKQSEDILKENGYDVRPLNTIIDRNIQKYKTSIKKAVQDKDVKRVGQLIKNCTEDSFKDVRGLFKFDLRTPANLIAAFVFLIIIATINTIFLVYFGAMTSTPLAAMALTAVIVAPVTEEIGKYLAIKGKMGSEFLLVFNIGEYLSYIAQGLAAGMNLTTIALIRIIPVIMHYYTAQVQVKAQRKDKELTGLSVAIIIHAVYNFIMSLGVLVKILGKV